jgi:glycosyltransferase involved in cell wall biosynthesis
VYAAAAVKIVHSIIGGEVAGGQLVALQHMRAARARGDSVLVVSPTQGPFVELVASEGFPVRLLDVRRLFRLLDVWRLKRLLETERADVLHTHTGLAANILSRIAGRLAGVPVVSHMHMNNHFRPNRLAQAVQQTLDNLTSRLCARIVVVSDDMRERLLRQGVPAGRLELIPNGIELGSSAAPPSRQLLLALGVPEDADVAITVGRLCDHKGQRELIEAVARLAAAHSGLRAVVVGDDVEAGGDYLVRLRRLAVQLGVEDRIIFTGYRPDARALVAESDVFVLPSWIEGCPLVVLEAMAAGTPVIATGVGGLPELVEHEETGLLVPVRDPQALAAAIERVLVEPGLREALGLAGQRAVASRLSAADMTRRMLSLYDEVAEAA